MSYERKNTRLSESEQKAETYSDFCIARSSETSSVSSSGDGEIPHPTNPLLLVDNPLFQQFLADQLTADTP